MNAKFKSLMMHITSLPGYFILFCSTFVLLTSDTILADESITIAIPYLSAKIDLFDNDEPVTRIIKNNITTSLIKKPGSNSQIAAHKIRRILGTDDQPHAETWELEYAEGIPLDKNTNLNPKTIEGSLQGLSHLETNYSADNNLHTLLANISTISFQSGNNRFRTLISLKESDPQFPNLLNSIPLLNNTLARVFKNEIGKSTNMPFYAPFIVSEFRPEESMTLLRNDYFGYPGDQSKSHRIKFQTYDSPEEAIRSLRTGSISIIALPSLLQIEEAKRDKTLQVLPAPIFSTQPDKEWKLHRKYWKTETDLTDESRELYTIDLQSVITRKSLEYDDQFTLFFELKNVSRGQL